MRVLLVDYDPAALESVARALRGVVQLECVRTKSEALTRVKQNDYDVLIACERVGDGSGLDLLGRIGKYLPEMQRVFAAAPERLQLLGPRLNPFKVAHTIAYPIDLEQLWLALAAVAGGVDTSIEETIEHVVLDETGQTPVVPQTPRGAGPAGGTATARKIEPEPDEQAATAPLRPPRAAPARANSVPKRPAPGTATPAQASAAPPPSQHRPAAGATPAAAWSPRIEAGNTSSMAAAAAAAAAQAIYATKIPPPDDQRSLATAAAVAGGALLVAALMGYFFLHDDDSVAAADAADMVPAKTLPTTPVDGFDTSAPESSQVADPRIRTLETSVEDALTRDRPADAARALEQLATLAPQHPRLAFLTAAVSRARESRRPRFEGRTLEEETSAMVPAAESRGPQRTIPASPPAVPDTAPAEPTSSASRIEDIGPVAPPPLPVTAAGVASVAPPVTSAATAGDPSTGAVAELRETKAELLSRTGTTYPPEAAERGIEGYAVVSFTVTGDGQVRDPHVIASEPPHVFDSAARDTVRRWRYQPATRDGVAVESSAQTRIEFRLQD
ncbi:MAG TPA: TonB family protein [Steroidobacteraceae bacterium]|nr:TonB family protein [Steroidobacteraceae bacterium]HRX89019.1 TonB family protein [Steroidobacteraceae bacterium]